MLTEVFGVTKLQAGGVLEAEVSTAGVKSVEWVNWSPNTFVLNGTDGRLAMVMLPYSMGRKNLKLRSKSIITNQTIPLVSSSVSGSQFFRTEMNEETGNEYVSQFPATAEVFLTGNTPPLDPVTPRLLATIPYSQFTVASANIDPHYDSVLTRSARERTFLVYNTMDQNLTTNNFAFYDSVFGITGAPNINPTANLGGLAQGGGGSAIGTSEETSVNAQGLLASHVDSLQIILGIGATLPTSGNVLIYVSELL